MKISELPYNNNSEEIFSLISDEPWSIFLDSGFPSIDTGRYDVIAARPSITLETYNEKTFIKVISPNFELKYNSSIKEIEKHAKQLGNPLTKSFMTGTVYGLYKDMLTVFSSNGPLHIFSTRPLCNNT